LVVAVPAATINALVVIALANKRIDGVFASVVSAAFWGAVIPAIALRLFGSETRNPIRGEHASSVITCLALTGALMGLVHWLIAVKPYRRWRLDADR